MSVAAVIGGGVIGAGWAARFALMGWDVRVFDPGPQTAQYLEPVLVNARRSLPGLRDAPMPQEGRLVLCDTVAEAVTGAAWIQESVPERLDIKQASLTEIQASCDRQAILASSTSGFTASQLRRHAPHPEQIIVAHPFNPVYLLPLVELVAQDPAEPVIARAATVLRDLGMYPLILRAEINAHIADRLLEAVWREALWLVRDDIATTGEIDEAIRMGFGLRWAQMGLFETYRIAGGDAGMAHFIEQFGPCLSAPWTRLTDVPELAPDLIAKIAKQSDAQSGTHTVRDLEHLRDTNLVAILRALKAQNTGAGAVLNAAEPARTPPDITRPITSFDQAVPLDWTDYNGHMTESRYLDAFGRATDRFMEIIGCDADYIASGGSFFTAETHIRHLRETHAGTRIRVETQVIAAKGKVMHLFHRMLDGEGALATGEHMLIHVSLETRRGSVPGARVAETLARITQAHDALPRPDGVGARIAAIRG